MLVEKGEKFLAVCWLKLFWKQGVSKDFKLLALLHANPLCLPLTVNEECYTRRATFVGEIFFFKDWDVEKESKKKSLEIYA